MKMSPKNTAGIWYHGSNKKFSLLREGSTITPNRALAEAFSHKPPILSCEADGTLLHNGKKYGYLYCIDEPIDEERDLYQHPRTTLEPGSEFLTARPLRVRWVADVGKRARGSCKTAKTPPEGIGWKKKNLIDCIPRRFLDRQPPSQHGKAGLYKRKRAVVNGEKAPFATALYLFC